MYEYRVINCADVDLAEELSELFSESNWEFVSHQITAATWTNTVRSQVILRRPITRH